VEELIFFVRHLARKDGIMRLFFLPLAFVLGLMGCAESINHDEALAGRRALEFAQIAFVKHDIENGYSLLSDSTKRYVSVEQFKEVVSRLHPKAFPTSLTASEYEPMPGEKAIHIYLIGENLGEHFYYRLTMEGTASTGYRVLRLYRGSEPYPPSRDKQKFKKLLSAQFMSHETTDLILIR
jgi:hypothetical protein